MAFLSYTIFTDTRMTDVREVCNLEGERAGRMLAAFKNGLKREPKEGDVYAGCRIDRIGSEEQPTE